jgi:HlyD family secretion protein
MTNNQNNQTINVTENRNQKSTKARTKRLWVILIFVAAAITVTVFVAASRKTSLASSNVGTFTVRKDNLSIIVTEGGSIRAHKSIQYKCQVERRRDVSDVSILSIVPAGTYVTQENVDNGMVLVQLDSSVLEDRLVQERMSLSSDQENVTSAKEAYDIQIIDNESDIANSELDVRFALLELQKYLGAELAQNLTEDVNESSNLSEHIAPLVEKVSNDPNLLLGTKSWQDIKDLQDQIVLAEGNLKTAQDTYTGTVKLHDANYVSDLELDRDRLTVINRQFQADSAKVSLDLFMRYDFPKTAEDLLSKYIEARRQLERTHAQCRSRLAQAKAKLSNAETRYKEQEEQVSELAQQIEYCTIKAKAPGLVVYGTGDTSDMYRAMRGRGGMSSGIIAEGEVVTEGQVIVSMPDTAAMVAEISVHETEVDKVRPGQPATIVMDAFPDQVLQGEVLEVAPLPDQQRGWMNPDLKVYQTLVKIDGSHDFLKSRMSCKVQILVRQLGDVLIVPIQVVSNRRGKKICYVMTPQGPEERDVQTGAFNDTFVQITDGLNEGDEVLLNPPLFSESTGVDAFQQQILPERRPGSEETDANDTAIQGQPGEQTQNRNRRFGGDRNSQGTRDNRQFGDGQTPQAAGPPTGMQLELTDERIDGILNMMAKFNPERAKELENLRKSDPEKLKEEIRKEMEQMRQRFQNMSPEDRERMRQNRRGMGQGRSNSQQGQGNAEGGQNRGYQEQQ